MSVNNSLPGVILLGHGSSEPEAGLEIRELCATLSESKPGWRFEHAFLNQEPKLDQAVNALISLGCKHIQILPLLVFKGKHILEDIPNSVEGLRTQHPEVVFQLQPYLCRLAGFKDLILKELNSHTFQSDEA